MTTKIHKPAKSLGKCSFKNLISDLSRFQRGNWLKLPALQMEKATINVGLITENLSVHTFILPGPLDLLGPGTMYFSYPPLVGPACISANGNLERALPKSTTFCLQKDQRDQHEHVAVEQRGKSGASTRQPSGSFIALASLHWFVFFLPEY